MQSILDLLKQDPNVAPAFKAAITQPTFFYGVWGRRRQYLSQADADAYNRGYCMWPAVPDAVMQERGGPEADGYYDHDEEQQERHDRAVDVGSEFDGVAP